MIQRIIEFLRSIPGIPLWMALSAALPPDWPIIRVYFGITVILSFLGWTGMARVVRTGSAAQKAVTYSTDVHQNQYSGFRYGPKHPTCDTAVTGWFIAYSHTRSP